MTELTGNSDLIAWDARSALEVAEKVHVEDEALQPGDVDLDQVQDVTDAVRCLRAAERQEAAAKAVLGAARQRVAEILGEGGAVRVGNTVVRFKRTSTERCIDPEGAAAFIGGEIAAGRVQLGDVVNPTYVKRTWMDQAVRDTFYERVEAENPTVTSTPIDRAPRFLQDLEDGQALVRA